ncbi:MAG TPA: class I SAM-dependent methyltransferase [Mariprofundaceae bacterium]|nr:class I SAM-dependent methyltransferase [Mariprofundaceae bacterium]
MKLSKSHINRSCSEQEIWNEQLDLDHKHLVELGCGRAELTRLLATEGPGRRMVALEVDEVQHDPHKRITDLPNVQFIMAGAEDVPFPDASFDVAFMFKSLHHVPLELMDQALAEVKRILKPGGHAYISEPVFAGDFNEILRMFHDEEEVRLAAFEAVKRAVDSGLFDLASEIFFNAPMHFEDFADFEQRILGVTHTNHQLSPELYERVKAKFETHMTPDGAHFQMPIRVDLLKKQKML